MSGRKGGTVTLYDTLRRVETCSARAQEAATSARLLGESAVWRHELEAIRDRLKRVEKAMSKAYEKTRR